MFDLSNDLLFDFSISSSRVLIILTFIDHIATGNFSKDK